MATTHLAAETPSSQAARSVHPLTVLLIFVTSGMTGLILEVVWSRMLVTLLGGTTWGVMATLVAYLGGLGLGGLLMGRVASRTDRPLRLYGLLELGVGVYTLAVPGLFEGIGRLYVQTARQFDETPWIALTLRLLTAMLALLPPTLLMGGTLPALTRAVAGESRRLQAGRWAGVLYAANTWGAVIGCFVTGFVLILWLGVGMTNTLAAILALTIGCLALGLDAWLAREPRGDSPDVSESAHAASVDTPIGPREGTLALGIATFSGFCALAYEVLWTRCLLALLTDNTTYAFTLMLTSYLAGHAFGSALASRRSSSQGARGSDSWLWQKLGLAQTFAGLLALVSLPLLVVPANLLLRLTIVPSATFWKTVVPFQLATSLLVLAPPSALLGASFPLAARLYVGRGRPVGSSTGRLYGLNTLGAISGAILAVALFIPVLKTQGSLIVLGGAQACLGLLLYVLAGGRAGRLSRATIAVPLGLGMTAGIWVNRQTSLASVYERREPGKLLALKEGEGATVTVHSLDAGGKVININGTNVAGTVPMLRTTQKLQAHLPLLLHPNPKTVMQVGFGSGGTCYSATLHEGVESIEVVEITPEVIEMAATYFPEINRGALRDPRVHVVIADARSHVQVTDHTYDVILSDSIHPRFRGNASLYTKDYFEACSRRLNPGGIVSTWLPMYGLGTEEIRGVLASVRSVFPHVQLWYPNQEPNENNVLIASHEPLEVDWRRLEDSLKGSPIQRDLDEVALRSLIELLDCFVLGERAIARLTDGVEPPTDDHPWLEFRAPYSIHRFPGWLANFEMVRLAREPIGPDLVNATPEEKETLAQWYSGTTAKLVGHAEEIRRRPVEAERAYDECVRLNPADAVARARRDTLRSLYLEPGRPR